MRQTRNKLRSPVWIPKVLYIINEDNWSPLTAVQCNLTVEFLKPLTDIHNTDRWRRSSRHGKDWILFIAKFVFSYNRVEHKSKQKLIKTLNISTLKSLNEISKLKSHVLGQQIMQICPASAKYYKENPTKNKEHTSEASLLLFQTQVGWECRLLSRVLSHSSWCTDYGHPETWL